MDQHVHSGTVASCFSLGEMENIYVFKMCVHSFAEHIKTLV